MCCEVRSLDLPVFGQLKLKGIPGHLVPADIVKFQVRLITGKRFVNITCAVVEKLIYALILGSDIVDRLNQKLMDESFAANEMMDVVHDEIDDNDDDSDFGSVDVIDTHQFQQSELLPSQRIDLNTLSHLSVEQRTKLLDLLDNYSENFSKNPGFVTVDQHEFDNSADCKPPRLKVNYMLEDLKPLIEAHLQELLRLSSVHPQRIARGPQRGVRRGPVQNGNKIRCM